MSDGLVDKGVDVIKVVAKEVYGDLAKPTMKATGEIIGLVPQAINAALVPLRQWIEQREYNFAETKKLLELKLANVNPENIETPATHIAVPALQYISYCMDNEELRNMYANLLANSMNSVVKKGVHPSFVDIIKQLSPDEAKILRFMSSHFKAATITVRYEDEEGKGRDVLKNFSTIGQYAGCEEYQKIGMYFDNLRRLGLLARAQLGSVLTNHAYYDELKEHSYVAKYANEDALKEIDKNKVVYVESYMELTDFGKSFCEICVVDLNTK